MGGKGIFSFLQHCKNTCHSVYIFKYCKCAIVYTQQ
nr:MAG TPA: hypothetical protein [Inoviridae sp.]